MFNLFSFKAFSFFKLFSGTTDDNKREKEITIPNSSLTESEVLRKIEAEKSKSRLLLII